MVDTLRVRAEIQAAASAAARIADAADRERAARELAEIAGDLGRAARRIRSGAVNELLDSGHTIRSAGQLLELSRSQVHALRGQGR